MRRFIFALIVFLIPAFTFAEVSSIDNGYAENIQSYNVTATLGDNASIDVAETIKYDFGNNEKHGIYRYIPTVYMGRNGNPRQKLTVKYVQNDRGEAQPYELSNENNNDILKIGDPNELITGIHTYKISYNLNHMISTNSDGDRFLWDAVGTGWEVPIHNIVIVLNSSKKLTESIITKRCYVGGAGSTASCEINENSDVMFVSNQLLPAHQGITVDNLFKSGTFPGPSKLELFIWKYTWYYWLPLIAFIGFFALWYEKGRDPKGHGTIVPMYDPPKGLTPVEATIILEDLISRKALPAAIISLAIQGYIKIHKKEVKILFVTKPEYELILLKPIPKSAPLVERKISDLFFTGRDTVNLNDLGDSFAQSNASMHRAAYKEVTEKGYFAVNPTISRVIFFSGAVATFVLGSILAFYLLLPPIGWLCVLLPGIISFLFAFLMPVKTKLGVITKEDLLGLKMYIKAAEIDRIKFHNAPEKSPEKFEELLPYAIIFGLEKQWAEEFKDVYKNPPSWYDGNFATFSVIGLTHDLGSFSDTAISASVSSSSGGAGGFAGGGGGGGGGGSW